MNKVVSVLIIRDRKYVLQHRDNIVSIGYPNTYSVWGGAVESQDVSNQAAAIRELREETGLLVDQSELVGLGTEIWRGQAPNEKGQLVEYYYYALQLDAAIKFTTYEGQGAIDLPIPCRFNTMVNEITMSVIKRYEQQVTWTKN